MKAFFAASLAATALAVKLRECDQCSCDDIPENWPTIAAAVELVECIEGCEDLNAMAAEVNMPATTENYELDNETELAAAHGIVSWVAEAYGLEEEDGDEEAIKEMLEDGKIDILELADVLDELLVRTGNQNDYYGAALGIAMCDINDGEWDGCATRENVQKSIDELAEAVVAIGGEDGIQKEEVDAWFDEFDAVDTDGDRVVTTEELRAAGHDECADELEQWGGEFERSTLEDIALAIAMCDVNDDMQVNGEDIKIMEEHADEIFEAYDFDDSGSISYLEALGAVLIEGLADE